MNEIETDVLIVGSGPVGLMCSYLGQLCGLKTMAIDKSDGPLQVGRADALNARTLQLMEIAGLFDELYPLGKPCNTSSIWADGKFQSRQSQWWDQLEGCLHKHFLMLGQSYVENLVDKKLKELEQPVRRQTTVGNMEVHGDFCLTTLSSGEVVKSKYIIGSDGARSFVRKFFDVEFEVTMPQIIWAVIDGVIESDFPKVPEIIVFQAETSDVAWIPREGTIDRFYVRMDREDFTMDEAIAKINNAMAPHTLSFKEITWSSKFAVKESVAEKFIVEDRVFLAGDSCHIHSVNGGQGLNTGLADSFNLMWKLGRVINYGADARLLRTYEEERKPVALRVVETSAELVRSTKYSESGEHAKDYVKIVEKRAGNVTGMGIRYGNDGLVGSRLFDFELESSTGLKRLYNELDYSKFTLVVFGDENLEVNVPDSVNLIQVSEDAIKTKSDFKKSSYEGKAILVRPDGYIKAVSAVDDLSTLFLKVD